MEIITKIAAAAPIISALYIAITGIVKYIKNNPESKLKIVAQSTLSSFATNVAVNAIALIIYIGVNLYFYSYAKNIVPIVIILISLVVIILLILFIIKDYYKRKYAFIIAMDYNRLKKEREQYSTFSRNLSENIANHFIDNNNFDDVIEKELDAIKREKTQIHKLNKVTKRYDFMSIVSWFALPLLSLNIFVLVFDKYGTILNFSIMVALITVLVIVVNTFIIYYDLNLQHGIVDQTSIMVEKHD